MQPTRLYNELERLGYRHDLMCKETLTPWCRNPHKREGKATCKILGRHGKKGAE